jgi:hypothetical protein
MTKIDADIQKRMRHARHLKASGRDLESQKKERENSNNTSNDEDD